MEVVRPIRRWSRHSPSPRLSAGGDNPRLPRPLRRQAERAPERLVGVPATDLARPDAVVDIPKSLNPGRSYFKNGIVPVKARPNMPVGLPEPFPDFSETQIGL